MNFYSLEKDMPLHARNRDPLHRAVLAHVPHVGRTDKIREIDRQFEALLRTTLDARAKELDPALKTHTLVRVGSPWSAMPSKPSSRKKATKQSPNGSNSAPG